MLAKSDCKIMVIERDKIVMMKYNLDFDGIFMYIHTYVSRICCNPEFADDLLFCPWNIHYLWNLQGAYGMQYGGA